ncbi:MAG: threonine synthase, partial [Muribaculaceae bacterium]|nr:threonine synthase [Muribaculaceae bacterium]
RPPRAFFMNMREMKLKDIAFVVCDTLFGNVLSSVEIKKIVDGALNFDIPLRPVSHNKYLLELFHGPTLSFKDVGARFMSRLLPALDCRDAGSRNVILATSGDSGGAVANAFQGDAMKTNVFVLFPKGELSDEQISQFATLRHVTAIEVDGSFDDCQHLVKEALLTQNCKSMPLTAGNSINLARELPSIIYFFHAYARAAEQHPDGDADVVIAVPCGNLGSLAAALMAKKMGLPVKRFIAANNANDVFVEYLKTGGFKPQRALLTLARAMDVGNPSNIARITDLYDGNLALLRKDVEGYAYDDAEISETMRDAYLQHGILIDPQGATALRAINRHVADNEVGIALASAHPAKFSKTVANVTGIYPQMPPQLEHLSGKRPKTVKIPATASALQRILKNRNINHQ